MGNVIRGCLAIVLAALCTAATRAAAGDTLALALALPSPHALPPGDDGRWPAFDTYRVHVRYAGRRTIDITFNDRNAFYAVAHEGSDVVRTYFVGSVAYNSFDGRPWERIDYARLANATATPAPGAARPSPPARATSSRWLGESVVHGRRYRVFGTFSATAERQRGALVETCLVDENTRLLSSCRKPGVYRAVFDHYDDPRNEFTVPRSVLNARDVTHSLLSRR